MIGYGGKDLQKRKVLSLDSFKRQDSKEVPTSLLPLSASRLQPSSTLGWQTVASGPICFPVHSKFSAAPICA